MNERSGNVLPVVQIPVSLRELGGKVDSMAQEEEVVLGFDGEGVAHKGARVDGQCGGHLSGDTVVLRDRSAPINRRCC